MKALNTMKFVNNAAIELTHFKELIATAETYEKAKEKAAAMFGYLDCLTTFLNTMICKENNDFTAEFDEVIEEWQRTAYQAVIDKALETKQDSNVIVALLRKRDEI